MIRCGIPAKKWPRFHALLKMYLIINNLHDLLWRRPAPLATLQDDAVSSNPDFDLGLALLKLDYEPVAGRRFHELRIIDLP